MNKMAAGDYYLLYIFRRFLCPDGFVFAKYIIENEILIPLF